jgi:hypothetical protein
MIRIVAATDSGRAALLVIADAFRTSDYAPFASADGRDPDNVFERDRAKAVAATIESTLKETDDPAAGFGPSKEEQADIDRLNSLIDADPRKSDYVKAGVRLPVKIHTSDRERDGGMYYSKQLPHEGFTTSKRIKDSRLLLVYLEIGGKALWRADGTPHTDAYVQSVVWHEFTHYRIDRQLQDKTLDKDPRIQSLAVEELTAATGEAHDQEVEAISHQLGDDAAKLVDDSEVKGVLGYLAKHFNAADPDFRARTIQYMTDPSRPLGNPNGEQRKRFVRLIKEMRLDKPGKRRKTTDPPPEDLSVLYQALGGK